MTRLIDADRLATLITELIPRHSQEADYGRGRVDSYKFVLKTIASAPTVEPERPLGECATCKHRACEITEKPCKECSRSWVDLYEEGKE